MNSLPASMVAAETGTAALSKYPNGWKAFLRAIIQFLKPVLSAGVDGTSQSKSIPSNLYCCRKLTAELTNVLIFVVLDTSREYLPVISSLSAWDFDF